MQKLTTLAFLILFASTTISHSASPTTGACTVEKAPFGTLKDGQAVELYTLRNANGLTAKVMTYGAIIYSLEVPDRAGKFANVTANRETLADYETRSSAFGSLLGRYANRIAHGEFTLDGHRYVLAKNGGPNHIHGGVKGFDKRVWHAEPLPGTSSAALKLTYTSKDGEEGYPGNLQCTILYELNNANEWKMEYTATTDKPTPINISNHAYWNLAGAQSGTMLDHLLTLNADRYLKVDDTLIPTGEIVPVEDTPLDFRSPHTVGERIDQLQARPFGGYDHCFVVNHRRAGDLVLCAKLVDPKSGRTMEVLTTQPGVQLFSANFGGIEGPNGYRYPLHLGLCLETQHYPDSPNHPDFPTTILRPGETYHEVTIHRFGIEPAK